jgi:hypothetical protein
MENNTTPIVDAIGELHFEGNIIPHSWYQHIKLPSGKADMNAIILLSDVIYWYRPTIKRDETTGAVVSINRKFKADMLQKQYEPWGELFGLTKRQTKDAVSRLVKAQLLKRVFRTVTPPGNGIPLANVMFIEPIIENVKTITFETRMIIDNKRGSNVKTSDGRRFNVAPTTLDSDTYTENTTENTTESNLSSINASRPPNFLNIFSEYKKLREDDNGDKRKLAGCVKELLEILDIKATFPMVQKARRIGDEKLSAILWRMYGMHIEGKFDEDGSSPEKYLFGSINNQQSNQPQPNRQQPSQRQTEDFIRLLSEESKRELIDKYKPLWQQLEAGENVPLTPQRKASLQEDAEKRGVTVDRLQKYLTQLFRSAQDG